MLQEKNIKIQQILNALSNEVCNLYGYVSEPGSNFSEPAINSGPCGPFANEFYKAWNKRFDTKVLIVFIIEKSTNECWHIACKLPDGSFYDGGIGIHNHAIYDPNKYLIQEMVNYDYATLDQLAYGLERTYPRYCPNFSLQTTTSIIHKYIDQIKKSWVD